MLAKRIMSPARNAGVHTGTCRRVGRASIPGWDWYVVFGIFRLAAIAQGIMGRVIAGTANDPQARARGERARPLAEAGWAIAGAMTR